MILRALILRIKRESNGTKSIADITSILTSIGFNSQNGYLLNVLRDITSLRYVSNVGIKSFPEKISSSIAESTKFLYTFLKFLHSFSFMLSSDNTTTAKSVTISALSNLMAAPVENQYMYPLYCTCKEIDVLIDITKASVEDISSVDFIIQRINSELRLIIDVNASIEYTKKDIYGVHHQKGRRDLLQSFFNILLSSIIINTRRKNRNMRRLNRSGPEINNIIITGSEALNIQEDNIDIPNAINADIHQQTMASSRKVLDSKLLDLCISYLSGVKSQKDIELNMPICSLILELFATIMADIPSSIPRIIEMGSTEIIRVLSISAMAPSNKFILSMLKIMESFLIHKEGDVLIYKHKICLYNIYHGYDSISFGRWACLLYTSPSPRDS